MAGEAVEFDFGYETLRAVNGMSEQNLSISPNQLAIVTIAMTTGSAAVYIPSPVNEASGSDGWLAIVIAYMYGLLMLFLVLRLHRISGGGSLIDYSRKLAGRTVTIVLGIPLTGMLLFAVPAIVAGIGDFLTSIMMDQTPVYVFNAISLLIAGMTVRAGASVMIRMFVLLVFLMLLFAIGVILLSIPDFDVGNLFPMFEGGILPMLHGAYITGGFPFGEIILLSMLLPAVNRKELGQTAKPMYAAFSFSGAMLFISVLSTTLTYGPAASAYKFSFFRLASEIQIANIFQSLEIVVAITLLLGSFMKATLFLYILNRILVQLCGLRDEKAPVFPLSLLCILLSLTMYRDTGAFLSQVYVIWPFTIIAVGGGMIVLFTVLSRFSKAD